MYVHFKNESSSFETTKSSSRNKNKILYCINNNLIETSGNWYNGYGNNMTVYILVVVQIVSIVHHLQQIIVS